jgi:hypothetical protein
MGEMRRECKILIRKPERKRPLVRPSRRWEDNIKTDFKERLCEINWIQLAQDRDQF